jgi:cytoskeletal protein CcmA (bactofilin family)
MKNPFKRTGFDSMISIGTRIKGELMLDPGTCTILDGVMSGERIGDADTVSDVDTSGTTLVIGGTATALKTVNVANVIVTGTLTCDVLTVSGQLSVKNGAKVTARIINYRSLVVEPKAMLSGSMVHLDATPPPDEHTSGIGGIRC